MAIVINGSGTVTGISVGGLPDGIVDTDTLANTTVTAAKVAADVATQAELDAAGGVDGITSSANATSITIDATENVGIRATPTSFYSGYAGLQVGGNGTLWGQASAGANNNFWIGQNVRAGTDGNEKAITTGVGSAYHMSGGSLDFYCFNSTSADANITKRYHMKCVRDSDTAQSVRFGSWVGNGTGAGLKFSISGTDGQLLTENNLTSTRDAVHFNNGNGLVGKIQTSGSATSYVTSSDYRLKENVNYTWDATTRLKQLKPARFNFIADGSKTLDGFLAHEVSSIVPEAISGEKDAMISEELYVAGDDLPDGKNIGDVKVAVGPDYQGIDQSKLVPLLVKTIQELEARITALEA